MDDERVVDVDEEGELGAGRERRDVRPLQLQRQLLVRLSWKSADIHYYYVLENGYSVGRQQSDYPHFIPRE